MAKGVKTVYISPAQRANQAQEAEGTMRAVERIIALSQVYPSILDNYDSDKLARTIHADFSADPSVLKTIKEVRIIREENAKAQQESEQKEKMSELENTMLSSPQGQAEAAGVLSDLRGQF